MYAVIRTGGKQYRVSEGAEIDVEYLGAESGSVELEAVMVVDGDEVLAAPADLAGASVTGEILDAHRAAKITGFTYKNKSNQRRRWGHRQPQSKIRITGIKKG